MSNAEFEQLQLQPGQEVMIVDKEGSRIYGRYIGNYDPKADSFLLMLKNTTDTDTFYLKEIQSIYK